MTVYNLVETATGNLIADSIEPIMEFSADRSVIETSDRNGIWNTSTLLYDPYPIDRRISVADLINRFTNQEKEDLIEAAKTIKKAATFIKVLPMLGVADLGSTFIQTAINGMESAGIIGAGRAAEILA